MIVGVTVGCLIVVAIIVFAVYKYKKKKGEQMLANESEIVEVGRKNSEKLPVNDMNDESLGVTQVNNLNNIKVLYN